MVCLQARPPACWPTGALLHRCLLFNLSAITQVAILKLHGSSPEFCTLHSGVTSVLSFALWTDIRVGTKPRLSAVRGLVWGMLGKGEGG